MTSPTTRETADHAELARLAEAADQPMPPKRRAGWWGRKSRFEAAFTPALCSALLSEIAALRGERDEWRNWYRKASVEINEQTDRATQAERQRDEAVGLLKQFHTRIMMERRCNSLGVNVAEPIMEKTRAFLANQGADQ